MLFRSDEVSRPALVTADTGTIKKYVQQALHPSLFQPRPRSLSFCNNPNLNTATTTNTNTLPEKQSRETDTTNTTMTSPPIWQRIPITRHTKKRKLMSPPPFQGLPTANRFSQLPVDLTENTANQPKERKPSKPPPIILYGIEDVHKLTELLETATEKSQFTYKIVNRNQLRINSSNVEVYKNLISLVREIGRAHV